MPTLKEAQDKVRELSKRGLDVVEDSKMNFAEKKLALNGEDGKGGIEGDIKKWTEEVQSLEFVAEKRKGFLAASGNHIEDAGADPGNNSQPAVKSWGRQIVESQRWKETCSQATGGVKGGNWSTGDIELKSPGDIELKTLLTEGTAGTPGGGYAIPNAVPMLVPGIVDIKFRKLAVADLFPQGATDSVLIRYLVETAVTNAAAGTAEGGLKPESAISFDKIDETLKKITTFLPISDEMLEDWAQAMSYIDARLGLFVDLKEDSDLLFGDGTGSNLLGLLNRSGLATTIVKGSAPSLSGDYDMDAVYRQITAIRTTAFLEPDSIVFEPFAWQNVILSKASGTGAYLANGPFASDSDQTLWGKKVVQTPALASGNALVGAFAAGGQIFRKGGLTVEASNSHADFFQRDITAIRAYKRLGLALYRPGAFGLVTGL